MYPKSSPQQNRRPRLSHEERSQALVSIKERLAARRASAKQQSPSIRSLRDKGGMTERLEQFEAVVGGLQRVSEPVALPGSSTRDGRGRKRAMEIEQRVKEMREKSDPSKRFKTTWAADKGKGFGKYKRNRCHKDGIRSPKNLSDLP